ncbi:recombinase family protein [Streptococcus suis]|nr:recombinase family protein [Streptococcus suis]
MKTCVGYVRYSVDVPHMMEQQKEILVEKASQLQLELLAIYCEVIGDTQPIQDRPEMAKAIKAIEKANADHLLVTNANRVTRSDLGVAFFEETILKPLGAKLFVCNEANVIIDRTIK